MKAYEVMTAEEEVVHYFHLVRAKNKDDAVDKVLGGEGEVTGKSVKSGRTLATSTDNGTNWDYID